MQEPSKEAALSEEGKGELRKPQGEHFDRFHIEVAPETRD